MTPEEVLAEDKRIIEEFASNPENKKNAVELAFKIQQEFNSWFTVPKLIKIFDVTKEEVAKQLEILMLLNLCVGKVEKKIPYFKIDLNRSTQRQLLLEQIAEKQGELEFLKEKLVKLD